MCFCIMSFMVVCFLLSLFKSNISSTTLHILFSLQIFQIKSICIPFFDCTDYVLEWASFASMLLFFLIIALLMTLKLQLHPIKFAKGQSKFQLVLSPGTSCLLQPWINFAHNSCTGHPLCCLDEIRSDSGLTNAHKLAFSGHLWSIQIHNVCLCFSPFLLLLFSSHPKLSLLHHRHNGILK